MTRDQRAWHLTAGAFGLVTFAAGVATVLFKCCGRPVTSWTLAAVMVGAYFATVYSFGRADRLPAGQGVGKDGGE